MRTSKLLAGVTLLGAFCVSAQAASATQNFHASGIVAPRDDGGVIAEQQWQKLGHGPWEASPGTLQSAPITPSVNVTGLSVNQYQFSDAATIASGTNLPSSNFVTFLQLPQANYFFESRSNASHSINATTKLVSNSKVTWRISEPASEVLLLVALSALAIVVRRKMPEKPL